MYSSCVESKRLRYEDSHSSTGESEDILAEAQQINEKRAQEEAMQMQEDAVLEDEVQEDEVQESGASEQKENE